ncbi:MAG: hypothetical protein KGI98_03360 [Euryarchaeota archaeon]|nr:hypothetical protein [Euryarchaeota archaeon]
MAPAAVVAPPPATAEGEYTLARPADALETALLLSHRIGREDIREALIAQIGMGWTLLGDGDKGLPLADRIPPGQDPFGNSAWGALHRLCAAQVHAAVGAVDTALKEMETGLQRLAQVAPNERVHVILEAAAAIQAAHEATGDPRFAAFPPKIREMFQGENERAAADRAAVRVDLSVFRPERARAVVELALEPLRAGTAPLQGDVPAYTLETLAEYAEETGDRSFLQSGMELLAKIGTPHQKLRAQASLGKAYREVGDLLAGERLLREAQGDLPSLEPKERVLGAIHVARVSARDGHLAGADALLQWARWQLTQITPQEEQVVYRRRLASGFAHVGAHLGDAARLEAGLTLIRNLPGGFEHDLAYASLGRYLVSYATVLERLRQRLDRLEARVGTAPPWGFKGLVAETREALNAGAIAPARQAYGRARRAVFHHIQEVPDMEELWKMMKQLHEAFGRWDPGWGNKTDFVRLLDEAQAALKVRDWRTLRDRLTRAQLLLAQRAGAQPAPTTKSSPGP